VSSRAGKAFFAADRSVPTGRPQNVRFPCAPKFRSCMGRRVRDSESERLLQRRSVHAGTAFFAANRSVPNGRRRKHGFLVRRSPPVQARPAAWRAFQQKTARQFLPRRSFWSSI